MTKQPELQPELFQSSFLFHIPLKTVSLWSYPVNKWVSTACLTVVYVASKAQKGWVEKSMHEKRYNIFSHFRRDIPIFFRPLVSYKLHWYFRPMNFHRVSLPLFVKHMSYSSHKRWFLINIFIMVFMNTKLLLRVCFLGDSICEPLEHDCNGILSLLYKHRLFLTSLTEEKWKKCEVSRDLLICSSKDTIPGTTAMLCTTMWLQQFAIIFHRLPCFCPS